MRRNRMRAPGWTSSTSFSRPLTAEAFCELLRRQQGLAASAAA